MGNVHNEERLQRRAWLSKEGWIPLDGMTEKQRELASREWFSVLRPRMVLRQQRLQIHIKTYGGTGSAISRLYRRAKTITMYDEALTFEYDD